MYVGDKIAKQGKLSKNIVDYGIKVKSQLVDLNIYSRIYLETFPLLSSFTITNENNIPQIFLLIRNTVENLFKESFNR